MKQLRNYTIYFVWALVAIHIPAFVTGCSTLTFDANISEIGDIPEPLIEPLPLTVGIFYSKEFRNYRTVQTNWIGENSTIVGNVDLGDANVALFNYLLEHTFQKVLSLETLPIKSQSIKTLDLIAKPEILDYVFYYDNMYVVYGKVSIDYEIHLFLPNGEHLSSWRFEIDHIADKEFYGFGLAKFCEAVTKEAMRDAATLFFTEFFDHININEKNCGDHNQ